MNCESNCFLFGWVFFLNPSREVRSFPKYTHKYMLISKSRCCRHRTRTRTLKLPVNSWKIWFLTLAHKVSWPSGELLWTLPDRPETVIQHLKKMALQWYDSYLPNKTPNGRGASLWKILTSQKIQNIRNLLQCNAPPTFADWKCTEQIHFVSPWHFSYIPSLCLACILIFK